MKYVNSLLQQEDTKNGTLKVEEGTEANIKVAGSLSTKVLLPH